MFVNLSRRSQSLVERQIRLIDDLEQGEQDAERLGSLFQMDHLATRMRRNSENLLVLAGHDSSRRWNQPVALVDVLRAAVSEIEQYERVSLNVQPGISVRGHAVNDAVHLLAELAENATSFSSAETPVTISGHLLSSGGVLLDITDQGVGMGAEEMAHANWRLDNPPVVDVAVSRRMGLFVVARLAARHGIRVRLRPAASGGLTALVWLPDEVVSRDGASPSGPGSRPRRGRRGHARHGRLRPASQGRPAPWMSARPPPRRSARPGRPGSASLEPGGGENGSALGPRRVPGAGPRPGWAPARGRRPAPARCPRSRPAPSRATRCPGRPGPDPPTRRTAASGRPSASPARPPPTAASGRPSASPARPPRTAASGRPSASLTRPGADTGQWQAVQRRRHRPVVGATREPDGAGRPAPAPRGCPSARSTARRPPSARSAPRARPTCSAAAPAGAPARPTPSAAARLRASPPPRRRPPPGRPAAQRAAGRPGPGGRRLGSAARVQRAGHRARRHAAPARRTGLAGSPASLALAAIRS